MNYRERLRKAIECPQFGNISYGEYGALRLEQRKDIKRLLDEMDRADEVIKNQFFKIERLNKVLEKGNRVSLAKYNRLKCEKEQLELTLSVNKDYRARIDKAIEMIDLIKPELWNISNKMTYKLIDIKNILQGDDNK